jgi:hypothetical protein
MQHTTAPPTPTTASQPLAISQTAGASPGAVVIGLTNTAATPLQVLSHVEAARTLLPWYSLELTGSGAPRRLALGGPANEASAITVELAPGHSLSHDVDLQRAALEPHNGAARLAPGTYRIAATYAVTESGSHWTGSISSGSFEVTLP